MQMSAFLEVVLGWLKREAIPFAKLATAEPSLEEVFLAVSADGNGQTKALKDGLQLDLE